MTDGLPRKSGQKPLRSKAWLAWPMRAILLVGTFVLCWRLVYPAFTPVVGLSIGGIISAAAIGLELWLTALLTDRTFARVVGFRIFIVDHLLSSSEESLFISPKTWDAEQDRQTLLESGPVIADDVNPFSDEYAVVVVQEEEIIDAEVVEEGEATR